ncbi:N-acetylmuramoyl-L-alanine amidase [bacterium]|nr:N-acetylmuramoyl-L-alanine amidase [bacterium]
MRIIDIREDLARSRSRKYATRPLRKIEKLVVHHSGTRGGTPKSFAWYHVHARGWPGIGYHYVISPDGVVFKTNALTTVSYHARGANLGGVGICLVGDFNRSEPTDAQMEALTELLGLLLHHHPGAEIVLHREVKGSRTSCPGLKFPAEGLPR